MMTWNSATVARFASAGTASSNPRQSGFTILELMLSLVLLAIGAALSLPSYRAMIEKRQLTHGAEQVMAFVNSAQLEATKRNQVVTVSYTRTSDTEWCFGFVLGETKCDCTETVPSESDYCAIDSVPNLLTNDHDAGRSLLTAISSGDGDYSYDPIRGIFRDLDDSLTVEMSSNDQNYMLNLEVGPTGDARLCSKNSAHSVPGYAVCPVDVDEESES